jgi:hypothetical protein
VIKKIWRPFVGCSAAALVLLALYLAGLARSTAAVRLDALGGATITRSGLMSAARRGDVIEPYEFTEYAVREPFSALKGRLSEELLARGFSASGSTATFAAWTKDDVEVCLYDDQPSSPSAGGEPVADRRAKVLIWRMVDNGWITQVRTRLIGG